ncbi:MAG: hypothetical protein H7X80_03490, partial [bacterium]|nr:hypothetical protein [Candidatus Kapabacteria bacterium]
RPIRGEPKVDAGDSATEEEGGSMFGDEATSSLFDAPGGNQSNPFRNSAVPGTQEYPYELALGTDVVASFRKFDVNAGPIAAPIWGIELKSNYDELNYPSIWGGRMTLNAILENIKIGAVLPVLRFGDSTLATSGIGPRPQKIIGGYGISFEGDFTAPVIQNSGLFNFHGSYTFSEVAPSQLVEHVFRPDPSIGDTAYLVRYDFQAFYTFGFYADPDARHLFRLKLGGTVYGTEGIINEEDTTLAFGEETPPEFKVRSVSKHSRGGVAGAIEYMRTGSWVPFGAKLQFVDNSVLAGLWMQFAIARNLDLKFDLKYFTQLFRDAHPWENPHLVVPAVSVKYHFGTFTPSN